MLFSITNTSKNITTHCGVLEFSAEEGRMYIPFWMQQHLQLKPGEIVVVKNATLPKGTYVKIRPQQKAFIEITDPKAVLENKLRNFSALTKGDTIIINYNNTDYCIDIIDVAANNQPVNAISIVETDVQVEFERPLDMPPSPIPSQQPKMDFIAPPVKKKKEEKKEEEKPKFIPFFGTGRRIDGKVVKPSTPPQQQYVTSTKEEKQSSSFVLGGSSYQKKETPKKKVEQSGEKKFVAFQGRGRTLK